MKLIKRVLDSLNKDISELFKRKYSYKYFRREDKGKGVYEMKRYDKKTGEEDSNYSVLMQTMPRELLLVD